MAVDEAARHQLYTRLESALGPESTSTLMTLLSSLGGPEPATRQDLVTLENGLRAEMADLRTELTSDMATLRSELTADMTALRTELTADMHALDSRVQGQLGELRTEMRTGFADLRGEVAVAMRRQTLGLVGVMVSLYGIAWATIVFGS